MCVCACVCVYVCVCLCVCVCVCVCVFYWHLRQTGNDTLTSELWEIPGCDRALGVGF